MSYGDPRWQKEAIGHMKFAHEHGVNTFDTANVYSNGLSEVYLGNGIQNAQSTTRGDRGHDKGNIGEGLIWANRPVSLTRWDSEYHDLSHKRNHSNVCNSTIVDVSQCHRFDLNTPIEETMQALRDIVKALYVRYIGISICYAWQYMLLVRVNSATSASSVHVMQNYPITNNLTPFISTQNHHSLVYREKEREMYPTLNHFRVGITPWSSLACGLLTRPFDTDEISTRSGTDPWVSLIAHPILALRVSKTSQSL
ncbi:NADP-dependent oxidoreductase domain-containing protein [Lactarius psammicola]|nr:NADP-dependent oxidoreductase domain-containing protein [Lactarius psammicola]